MVSDNISAVAAQIKEKALQLASERASRDVAVAELEAARRRLAEETKKNEVVRRELLSTVRTRHGMELEIFKIKEQQEGRLEATKKLTEETAELHSKARKMDEEWKSTWNEMYSFHEAKRDLYQRSLEIHIQRSQAVKRRRKQKLDCLSRESGKMMGEANNTRGEIEMLRKALQDSERKEEIETEEISSLSMQIKSTLLKVGVVHIGAMGTYN